MSVRIIRRIVFVVAAVFLSACAAPNTVHNVSDVPVVSNKANPTADDVRQAIVRAGAQLGWAMKPDRPGHILGTLTLRQHVAVVDIDYTPKSYSIKYKDSTNLNYDGTSIHRNYNGWIQNLDKAIRTQLNVL